MQSELPRFDHAGFTALTALTYAGASEVGSLARPLKFICADGKVYWVKHRSQSGLVAELIAGRLAHVLDVGPPAQIIEIPMAAMPAADVLPAGAKFDDMIGLQVGILDVPNTENSKEIARLIPDTDQKFNSVNQRTLMHVTTFQTWIGVRDQQALIHLDTGRVYSIDHGDCFHRVENPVKPQIVLLRNIANPTLLMNQSSALEEILASIESLSDDDLKSNVAGIPHEAHWRSDPNRRQTIVDWLSYRRDHLREVMDTWMN